MTTDKSVKELLDDNLRRLHAYAQIVEETIRRGVEDTAQMGREAEAVQLDFEAFAESWAAMLPIAHDLAEAAGVDPSVLASGWGDLLITIRGRINDNDKLRKTLETSISDKIANARLIEWNPDWFEGVTPRKLADKITMAPDRAMIEETMAELASRGEPATLRLHWMAQWLKRNGYC